jgi:hypothetical protein
MKSAISFHSSRGTIMQSISLLDASVAETFGRDAGCGAVRTQNGCLPLVSLDVRATIIGLQVQTQVQLAIAATPLVTDVAAR